jgi:hypothetical protein
VVWYNIYVPKVIHENGYRVSVWPNDHPPPHVHVYKAGRECLVEIGELGEVAASLYENRGLSDKEWQGAVALVQKYQELALKKWRESRADD